MRRSSQGKTSSGKTNSSNTHSHHHSNRGENIPATNTNYPVGNPYYISGNPYNPVQYPNNVVYYDDYSQPNMNYNRGFQQQSQKQLINEQQEIDRAMSHDILFQLLATAEAFAVKKSEERQFKGYEICNSSSKSRKHLKNQFLIISDTFKQSYKFFKADHHQEYEFPENLPVEEVIELFKQWKELVKDEEEKEIYDMTIDLLSKKKGSKKKKVKASDLAEDVEMTDVTMGNLMQGMAEISYSNEKLAENVRKEIKETGKYKSKVVKGAQDVVDPQLKRLKGDLKERVPGREYPKQVPDDPDEDMR